MRKILLPALLVAALLLTAGALADTVIDGTADRGIVPADVGPNLVDEWTSPTTGRDLSQIDVPRGFAGLAADGRYQPMLVQIDNTDNGLRYRAPWGAAWADVIFESPLRREGHTRITLLFSDVIPDDAGPVRSARIGHVWLREEWGAGFIYYGQQEYHATDVKAEIARLGADKAGVVFSGTAQAWNRYFYQRRNLKSPHDKGVDVAGLQALIPADNPVPAHAWRFTDEPAQGDTAGVITVDWGRADYRSVYTWSPSLKHYTRTVGTGGSQEIYHDLDSGEAITFDNIIVQWVDMDWVQATAPVMRTAGDAPFFTQWSDGAFTAQGNADFFMNGVHVAGCWRRESMGDRTVFYGPDGEEIALQRGRTMVIMFPAAERQIHENGRQAPTPIDMRRSVSYR